MFAPFSRLTSYFGCHSRVNPSYEPDSLICSSCVFSTVVKYSERSCPKKDAGSMAGPHHCISSISRSLCGAGIDSLVSANEVCGWARPENMSRLPFMCLWPLERSPIVSDAVEDRFQWSECWPRHLLCPLQCRLKCSTESSRPDVSALWKTGLPRRSQAKQIGG